MLCFLLTDNPVGCGKCGNCGKAESSGTSPYSVVVALLSAGAVPTWFRADAERVARAADGADGGRLGTPRGHISCCFCLKLHELPSEDDQPPEPESTVRTVRTVRVVRNTGCTVSPGRRAAL